jgi:hypothetical protein
VPDRDDPIDIGDRSARIAIHDHEIGALAGLDGAAILEPEQGIG